jgi:NAD+ diphosphatase
MALAQNPIMFTNNPLDRAGHLRGNEDWLAAQLASETALIVPFWHLQPLVLPEIEAGDGRDVGYLPKAAFGEAWLDDMLVIFLGLNRRGKPLFVADISHMANPEDMGPFKGMGQFEDLRGLAAAGDMARTELAILAQAKGMLHWNLSTPFCAQCGTPSRMAEGGYKRICSTCETEHFPRTDPVVIMLPVHGEACLLGRQAGWPEGMMSALAGFMEPGESIEEAVARELQEEAGLEISSVRYIGAQPWPFPGSLMIGCIAEASNREISVDEIELEEARWVSRSDIISSMAGQGPLGAPPPMAIAHQLMKAFADGTEKG